MALFQKEKQIDNQLEMLQFIVFFKFLFILTTPSLFDDFSVQLAVNLGGNSSLQCMAMLFFLHLHELWSMFNHLKKIAILARKKPSYFLTIGYLQIPVCEFKQDKG